MTVLPSQPIITARGCVIRYATLLVGIETLRDEIATAEALEAIERELAERERHLYRSAKT